MVRFAPAIALLLLASTTLATPHQDDIDTEAAKRHFRRGSELYTAGNFAGALKEFQEALLLKPLPALHYNIAKCYDRLDRAREAVEAYERYLNEGPIAADIHAVRARIVKIRESWALDDAPTRTAKEHFRRGTEHYAAARYEEALVEFHKAYEAKPLADLHHNIGRCYDRLERYPEAIKAYEAYLATATTRMVDIEARIDQLKKRLDIRAKRDGMAPVAMATAIEPKIDASATTAAADASRKRKWVWPFVGGLVGAAVIGAVVAGVVAATASSEPALSCPRPCLSFMVWN